jgi:ATP-dependent 26S proteasome regulatory subunit
MAFRYGESERLLSEVFRASEALDGCIIFLDEIDSLATSR